MLLKNGIVFTFKIYGVKKMKYIESARALGAGTNWARALGAGTRQNIGCKEEGQIQIGRAHV